MTESQQDIPPPTVTHGSKIPAIWLIPIVTLIIGGWLVYQQLLNQGVLIEIRFETASGLEAGVTKIKLKEVDVGVVEQIRLTDTLDAIEVQARIERSMSTHLRRGSRFWIERPRVGVSGISGLGTILAGSYIQFEPADEGQIIDEFVGLEEPPLTSLNQSGVAVILETNAAASINKGTPLTYNRVKVGQVEAVSFSEDYQSVEIRAFIQSPYDTLVRQDTFFWNASGLHADFSADGLSLELDSLESLLIGGIGLDFPHGAGDQPPVANGHRFTLHENRSSVGEQVYTERTYVVLRVDQSVRGLKVGAPVEYRGGRVGTVTSVEMQYNPATEDIDIPIIVALEPQRFLDRDSVADDQLTEEDVASLVARGLYARLEVGNLLTGQLYVALDFDDQRRGSRLTRFDGYPELPTEPTDIGRITKNVDMLLSKINELDLAGVLVSIKRTLASFEKLASGLDPQVSKITGQLTGTLRTLENTLGDYDKDAALGYQISDTLEELQETAQALQNLIRQLEEKPNSLIFGKERDN